MKCEDCCYYWKEDHEDRAYCHFTERGPEDKAPCEYDDYDYTNDYEEE